MWLPRRRITMKPIRSKAARIFRADVRGSLGMRHLEGRHEWVRSCRLRKFLQRECSRFFQIFQRLFDGMPLTNRADFRALGDEDAVFFMDYCGQHVTILPHIIP